MACYKALALLVKNMYFRFDFYSKSRNLSITLVVGIFESISHFDMVFPEINSQVSDRFTLPRKYPQCVFLLTRYTIQFLLTSITLKLIPANIKFTIPLHYKVYELS